MKKKVEDNGITIQGLFKKLDVATYNYKINKYLTNGFFILLLIYLLFVGYNDGWDVLTGRVFIECPVSELNGCINPYYDDSCKITGVECEPELMYAGEMIGEPPSIYANLFVYFALFGFLFVLLFNHFLYNADWRWKN